MTSGRCRSAMGRSTVSTSGATKLWC
uniref:Uncharacterized protein n=1 Tax=Anguilla anguilla TaxID=7936 RepID=A0A0E9XQG1_ANGAN